MMRLSDKIALMFQRAFAHADDGEEPRDWCWEFSIMPHSQQGTVLYIAVMAPGPAKDQVLSTGLVVPGPSSLSQESIDSLAQTLMAQMTKAQAEAGERGEFAHSSGVMADGGMSLHD